MKFNDNPSSGGRVLCGPKNIRTDGWTDRQTDMTKLIFAFRNFAKRLTCNLNCKIPSLDTFRFTYTLQNILLINLYIRLYLVQTVLLEDFG